MCWAAPGRGRRSLAALRERYPELTLVKVQQDLPPLSASYRDRVFDALRSVGLPA